MADKEYVAYDCETTGLTKLSSVIGFSLCADECVAYYASLAYWNPTLSCMIDNPGVKAAAHYVLKDLAQKNLIMHNAVFDCMMAEAYFKIRLIDAVHTDTMILAHLLNENRRVGLKDLAASMFGENATIEQQEMKASVLANGGKITKTDYEMYKADQLILGKYGAKDAWLTYMLFYALVPDLYKQGLDKFFYEDESMPLLRGPTYEQNNTGMSIDLQRLGVLKKTLEAECLEAKEFIYREIQPRVAFKYPGTTKKNTFNIGSPSQLAWLVFGVYELEFGRLTDGGKAVCKALDIRIPYAVHQKRQFVDYITSHEGHVIQQASIFNGKKKAAKKVREPWFYLMCDKGTLAKHSDKYKWIAKLLEFQRKNKLLSTYVKGIESRAQYGIIRPSFLQHGTTSGRYASRNPNFQNLPRDDKRIKECIRARVGKVYVGADYSQLEPRVFAYVSQDARLMAAFNGTDDFYSVIGMEVFEKYDCTPKKDGSPDAFGIKYKKLRDLSKVIALASTYGATAHQLAPKTGKSIDDTEEDIASYFERFSDVKKMMTDSHDMAKRTGEVSSLFGRKRRIPEAARIIKLYGDLPHNELPYEARNVLNLSVNHRIQGTAANIVNRAAIQFYRDKQQAGIDCAFVCQVHDSLIVECNQEDAENVAALLQNAMENTTTLKGVPLEAIPKIGINLAEV